MKKNLNEIKNRLRTVIELEKRRDGLKRLFDFISLLSCSALFILLLEALFNFGQGARTFIFFGFPVAFAVFAFYYIALPVAKDFLFFIKPDFVAAASKVGVHFPEIKDELANAVQLLKESQCNYSPELIDAAFERVFERTKEIDFNSTVDFTPAKRSIRTCILIFLSTALLILLVPQFGSAANRIFNYDKSFSPPPLFIFEISPGNKEITKGDDITITVKTIGLKPDKIYLASRAEEESEFKEKEIAPDPAGNFIFEAASVRSSFEYYAHSSGIESEVFKISVVNRPVINGFSLELFPPAYSKLPPVIQKDNGNLYALPGSRVKINLFSSRDLSKAVIHFSDSTSKPMRLNSRFASAEFNITKETEYSFGIADINNIANINPVLYSIKLLSDLPPSIEIISPDENVKLTSNLQLPISVKISDDYGFSALNLNYRLTSSKYRAAQESYEKLPVTINTSVKEDEVYYVWDLAPLVPAEGETFSYYLEVFDNDNISGPKSARTNLFTIQIPSMDELFAEADYKQQEAAKDLTETFKEAEKLGKELQKISDDLKQKQKEISWNEKERVEKAAAKYEELLRKTEEAARKLNEMQKDLAQNNLLSEETLKKYNELQDLMEEFDSEELREALDRLRQSLQNMNRDNVQMSLEELKANEEYFRKSLERTLNLLKRIQVEQKTDELIKRAEELTKKIEELKEITSSENISDKKKRDELAGRQEELTESLEKMNEELEKLEEKMSDLNDMPAEEMKKLLEEFEHQMNDKLSEEAAKQLREMMRQNAMQNQQQLSQNMRNTGSKLKEMQEMMRQMNQMQSFYDMMKILDDLLTLSKEQEELRNNTERLNPGSTQFGDRSRDQNTLRSNLSKILRKMSTLSQKTFSITPEMGRALGNATAEMDRALNAMQNRNTPQTVQGQTSAMRFLNEAAGMMKNGIDQMMSGGGQGGGMMSLMQQLQQLSQQQLELNRLTQMMNSGQITQQMAAQMERLASQQEAIRKSLEELNREAQESGRSKRLASNLEQILHDMREVITNLQSEKIDDSLVKQQEKILSRMLDAQRSINERDFEQERKSNTGRNTARTSPPDLILSSEEGRSKLRDELLKAAREGYKKDYEELIRKYFEKLEKNKKM